MKQGLWVLNSSLIVVFLLALFVSNLLIIEPPIVRLKSFILDDFQKKKVALPVSTTSWDKIFQNDLFGTYIAAEVKATKQSFVTPIPEPKPPTIIQPPEVKKVEFIAPLAINVKGIIVSSDENKSVAMIADEAGKESLYHLGDKIKDAQLIRIARNHIVLMRANGQQEIFYLNKLDLSGDSTEKWRLIVKKIDDQNYEVDLSAFVHEVESLGNFMERASLVGTVYADEKPVGIRIGNPVGADVALALGFALDDIILHVNDISTADVKDRVKIYDAVQMAKIGDVIKVGLRRAEKDVVISYKLTRIDKPKKTGPVADAKGAPGAPQASQMSRLQEREETIRDFSKQRTNNRDQQTLMEIRKRLLANLQNRLRNTRVRS